MTIRKVDFRTELLMVENIHY